MIFGSSFLVWKHNLEMEKKMSKELIINCKVLNMNYEAIKEEIIRLAENKKEFSFSSGRFECIIKLDDRIIQDTTLHNICIEIIKICENNPNAEIKMTCQTIQKEVQRPKIKKIGR